MARSLYHLANDLRALGKHERARELDEQALACGSGSTKAFTDTLMVEVMSREAREQLGH